MAQKKKTTGGPGATRLPQTDLPLTSLQKAQAVAAALVENYGGKDASPPDVALALNISPTSSSWRYLANSAVAYGITEGGWNAARIALTPLGRKLVAPEAEGEDVAARLEAILKPRILSDFFARYRRAKLPNDQILTNVLKGMRVSAERFPGALDIVKDNGRYAGVIKDTPNGPFINVDSPSVPGPATSPIVSEGGTEIEDAASAASSSPSVASPAASSAPPPVPQADVKAKRIFITHGKQKGIVAQLKELLAYGNRPGNHPARRLRA